MPIEILSKKDRPNKTFTFNFENPIESHVVGISYWEFEYDDSGQHHVLSMVLSLGTTQPNNQQLDVTVTAHMDDDSGNSLDDGDSWVTVTCIAVTQAADTNVKLANDTGISNGGSSDPFPVPGGTLNIKQAFLSGFEVAYDGGDHEVEEVQLSAGINVVDLNATITASASMKDSSGNSADTTTIDGGLVVSNVTEAGLLARSLPDQQSSGSVATRWAPGTAADWSASGGALTYTGADEDSLTWADTAAGTYAVQSSAADYVKTTGAWTRTANYNPPGWIDTLNAASSDGQSLDQAFTYEADGSMESRAQVFAFADYAETISDTFGYDGQRRLSSADGSSEAAYTSYDPNNNLWAMTQDSAPLSFESAAGQNLLAQVDLGEGAEALSYNARGQMVSGLGRAFEYDNTTGMTTAIQGSADVRLAYGGSQQRVLKQTDGTPTVYFAGAGQRPLAQLRDGVWSVAVYGPTGPVAWLDTQTNYLLTDLTGSVLAVVSDTDLVGARSYLPFGLTLETHGNPDAVVPSVPAPPRPAPRVLPRPRAPPSPGAASPWAWPAPPCWAWAPTASSTRSSTAAT